MKKCTVFLLALCLILSLCACRAEDPENLFGTSAPTETSPSQSDETTAPTDALTPESTAPKAPVTVVDDDCGVDGLYLPYEGRVLFHTLHKGSWRLFEYDPETGEVSPFCKDATCVHGESGCNSGDVGALELYNGKLYGSKANPFRGDSTLVELKDGRFEPVLEGIGCYWHAYGNLYVQTADNSLVVYPQGSNKPQVLLEEYTGPFLKIQGKYLYGNGYTALTRVDLTAEAPEWEILMGGDYAGPEETMKGTVGAKIDGEYIYYINFTDFYLRRCKLDGTNPELILETPVGPASPTYQDPKWIYFASDDWEDHHIYRVSKEDPTDVTEFAEMPCTVYSITPVLEYGLLFVDARTDEDYVGSGIFVVDVNSGEWKELELPDI